MTDTPHEHQPPHERSGTGGEASSDAETRPSPETPSHPAADAPRAPLWGRPAPHGASDAPRGADVSRSAPYGSSDTPRGADVNRPASHGASETLPGADSTRPAPPRASTPPRAPSRRRGILVVVAALAIGALIGGVTGASVAGILGASRDFGASVGSAPVTINNPDSVNAVTAAAAKALPSVGTISVENGQTGGTGSGVLVAADGTMLTNAHVVTLDGKVSEPKIRVTDFNGGMTSARVIGIDPTADLAVIRLDSAMSLTPATFADSDRVNVGDLAVAIGAPLGLKGTVTDGIVSSQLRSITVASSAAPTSPDASGGDKKNGQQNPFDDFRFDIPGQKPGNPNAKAESTVSLRVMQTDAAINPGNSGGALVNSRGEVMGIPVAIAGAQGASSSDAAGNIGIGFAIVSNVAKRIVDEIVATGKASHGLFGATVQDTEDMANSTTAGAKLKDIVSDGAAAAAGLQSGDVVTQFDGLRVFSGKDLSAYVRSLPGGAKAEVKYVRGGDVKSAEVTLGEFTT